ncbi:MAG: nuclear transport factor 2 family protein [Gammaproteobacteria bacterium]|nr:nuclear transport factor 2 family protein [Gammaproteobacteria bacterium]
MTAELERQVRWLLDRAAISELLHGFARALDTRDYQAYADNYTEGGSIELPDPMRPGNTIVLEKVRMLELVPRSLGRYAATHHISSNHQIEIQGDSATSRSYLQAVHVNGDPADHWSVGGWYDCDYVRTSAGWKFSRVRLTPIWLSGAPGEIKPD